LKIKLNNGKHLTVHANIVPAITGMIRRKPISLPQTNQIEHLLKSLDLADTLPTACECSSVELLIGNDYYLDIVLPHRIEVQPGLYLLSSKLGWIIGGRTNNIDNSPSETNMLMLTYGTDVERSSAYTSEESVNQRQSDLEDPLNLKSIEVTADSLHSVEDKGAIKQFKKSNSIVTAIRYKGLVKDKIATENNKVLGHIENDTLSLKPTTASNDKMSLPTKRIVLREMSSVYDPIGLFSPILFRGKMILQRLWSKHLRWEDE